MNLLEKFNNVEIKADSRVSEEDRLYCQVTEKSYCKSIDALIAMAGYAQGFVDEQSEILSELYPEEKKKLYRDDFLGDYGFDPEKYTDHVKSAHRQFITRVIEHFSSLYKCTLDADDACEKLVPQKPEFNDNRFYSRGYTRGWKDWTDEEMAEYKAEQEEHRKMVAEYEKNIISLRIPYTDILDQIFIQLGGFSFQDKALLEMKERCHKAAWSSYKGEKEYEQKKAVLSFTGYACHYSSWGRGMQLSDGMKHIMEALSYFETGVMGNVMYPLSSFCGYEFENFDVSVDSEKIKSVKCFKNGRVDIRFQSEALAREFSETFLGLDAA